MRICITGATGFVGSHIARRLAEAGHDLRLLTRASSDLSALDGIDFERAVGDLTDRGGLAEACRDVDAVVHVAGLTGSADASRFHAVNAQGTGALAVAAREVGAGRFICLSSLAALGPSPVAEDPAAPPHPVSDYGRSKLEGERLAVEARGDMRVEILRPPAVYGPRDSGLLPFFKMAKRRYITRLGDGSSRVSMIYGPDLADAIAALIDRDPPDDVPQIFHLADAAGSYTWRELVAELRAAFGHGVWEIPVPPPAFAVVAQVSVAAARLRGTEPMLDRSRYIELIQPAWVCDSVALEASTSWTPTTRLDEGLAATLAWYRANGWL